MCLYLTGSTTFVSMFCFCAVVLRFPLWHFSRFRYNAGVVCFLPRLYLYNLLYNPTSVLACVRGRQIRKENRDEFSFRFAGSIFRFLVFEGSVWGLQFGQSIGCHSHSHMEYENFCSTDGSQQFGSGQMALHTRFRHCLTF